MKTSTLAFVPTLLLGLAAADSWGQWDETVTAKVTNTHYTCPCDGASSVVVGKPQVTPAPETYIEWAYFEESVQVCDGNDSDWGNCYESTTTKSYAQTMTKMTPVYTSIPTTKTHTNYVTYTTAECEKCKPKTLTKTEYTTLCETPIYAITQTGPVTHTHTAYVTYTTIACQKCQPQTLTSTAYTTMVGSPIYASPTGITRTNTAYATYTTTVCNMNGACYASTSTATVYTTTCVTPSTILPTLTATSSTTASTSTSSFTTYTSSGTVIVSPILSSTSSTSTSSATTTSATTTTTATTSFTTYTSSGTVIVSPILSSTSSTSTSSATTTSFTTFTSSGTVIVSPITATTTSSTTTTSAAVTTTTTTSAAVITTTTTTSSSTTSTAAQATTTINVAAFTYIDAMLTAHNVHRSNHSEVALTWDANLASIAGQTAASCVYAHDTTTGGGGYGQNIGAGAAGNAAAGLINNLMYNGEINSYPLPYGNDNPDLSNFSAWGHYSQIVWAATTAVGCATQYCPNGLQGAGAGVPPYFTVCNYQPAGNFVGQFSQVKAPLGGPTVVIISQ